MQGYVALIMVDRNYMTRYKGWNITSLQWLQTPCSLSKSAENAKFMVITYTNRQLIFIPQLCLGLSKPGVWTSLVHPRLDKGRHFISAATNYFSKWFKATPLVEVKADTVINFVKNHIICRFGVPKRLYHDNGPQFSNDKFYRFCNKYGIHCCPSTA